MMESQRRRVQQKGRFTITEIIPSSPSSAQMSLPTSLDNELPMDNLSVATDDTPVFTTSNCSDAASTVLHSVPPLQHDNRSGSSKLGCDIAECPAEESLTQPTESVPIQAAITFATKVAASAVNSVKVSISTTTCATGSPSQKFLSPKKLTQRIRRIKRRGRFTIIEMPSESLTPRKNADGLNDRFITTTSTEDASAAQLEHAQLSRSADNYERRTKPKRATRSLSRSQRLSGIRRFRRRSESPTHESIKPVDGVYSNENVQLQEGRAKSQIRTVAESSSTLTKSSVAASAEANALASVRKVVSMTSVSIPDNECAGATTRTSIEHDTPSLQAPPTKCCLAKPPQSSITISAARFLQQQQTIASLVRQQHDLKQIISVLQEQQQQLLIIPTHINELKRQKLNFNNGEIRDNEMRALILKVDTLTATNESLHSLISSADREARYRALEIECLSEENDELRHRCGQLETRYMDERKQGFVLEEEIQRLRMLSLSLQEQHLCQQQQQKKYQTTA